MRVKDLHPNILKIYGIIAIILSLLWALLLLGIINFGWIRFFFLVIFTLLFILSSLTGTKSKPTEGFRNMESGQGP
ncbi:MAG: hypothetical protein KGY76_01580 [Candidatus Thermoplasmatota archaeon]|nr:hypothetical protein [Candidatus Thermoplasmatota archaeon]